MQFREMAGAGPKPFIITVFITVFITVSSISIIIIMCCTIFLFLRRGTNCKRTSVGL
jgi:hypothetical protein